MKKPEIKSAVFEFATYCESYSVVYLYVEKKDLERMIAEIVIKSRSKREVISHFCHIDCLICYSEALYFLHRELRLFI